GQSEPNGQPQGPPPGNWGQWPPADPNQAPAYGPYSQPGPHGPYSQPGGPPPGNWGQWPPAGPNQTLAYSPYSQPGGPLGPY
ncbi:hypothetical protein ACJMK2_007827, partial [Sinanodonta woodiana]